MKVGTESPVKTGIAIVLAILAVVFLARMYFGGTGQAAPTANVRPVAKTGAKTVNSLDPTLRTDLLRSSEGTKYEGTGRNIFIAYVEPPPQPKVPVYNPPPQQAINTGPPSPPPINMKFIGFANKPGQPRQIFLMQNEDVFVAKEGEIVNRRYKVVKINSNSVEIEDVLNNNHQSIPLTQG